MSKEQSEAQLFYLLQKIYFDSIDNSKADEAVEAMHPEVRWVHNQVWEHDGHRSEVTDILEGRESVKEFLRRRVIEMQKEGIIHKVNSVSSNGELGAFQADVIGPDETKKPFFGLVKVKEGKIYYYRVLPKE